MAGPAADLGDWLEGIGLGRYRALFAEHRIDAEVLPYLTEADLRQLAMPLGDRRKLLHMIASAGLGDPSAVPRPTTPSPAPERRQITVLFCDLVGSTALAAKLDPEDLRDVMRAYFDRCVEVIERLGGHVARFMGDGIMAYFGYPRAQEDAAERAVRTGCELAPEIASLQPAPGVSLEVRVGIATGLVVVGDILGEGSAREEAVIGATPSLAARLQAMAEPGAVLIGDNTRRLVSGLFGLTDLGLHELKGIEGPTRVWRVSALQTEPSRFDVARRTARKKTVGREGETAFLLERWTLACAGRGQAVLVSGVPGIGKSNLVRELGERIKAEPHRQVHLQCSPFHSSTALHPVIDFLRRLTGFDAGAAPAKWMNRISALLAVHDLADELPVFADLLLTPGATSAAPDGSTEQAKRRLLAALAEWLVRASRQAPVLLVLEDAHWADPTMLELLHIYLERIASESVLVVVTHRPEFDARLADRPGLSRLQLDGLPPDEVAELIGVVAGRALPEAFARQIIARTDGVPLFVEELTKTLIEAGLPGHGVEPDGGPAAPVPHDIPETLQDSLLARLERLGRGREVAQVAAAIGREFDHELLAAIATIPRPALDAAIAELRGAGLLHDLPDHGAPGYMFSHTLVQEAAYSTLLHSRRRELHARISWALEERFPEIAESQPAVLAHHYTEANLLAPAITWWQQAAERSRRQSANAEAIEQYQRALAALRRMPASAHRDQLEVALRSALDPAIYAAMGPASTEREENLVELSRLHKRLGDVARMLPVLWHQCVLIYGRCELPRSAEKTREYLRIAEREGDPHTRAAGHLHLGHTELLRGDVRTGLDHLDHALTLYRPADRPALIANFALDLRPFTNACRCLALQQIGAAARGAELGEAAVREAHEGGHFVSTGQVLFLVSMSRMIADDPAGVERFATELASLAARHQSVYWNSHADLLLGWAMARQGRLEEGLGRMRAGAAQRERMKGRAWVPQYLAQNAELLIAQGRTAEALRLLDEAEAVVAATDHRISEAEIYRQRAAALARARAPSTDVEALLHRALAIARERRQAMWEARAAADLAARKQRGS